VHLSPAASNAGDALRRSSSEPSGQTLLALTRQDQRSMSKCFALPTHWLLLSLFAVAASVSASDTVPDGDITVHATKDGAAMLVDVDCPVAASRSIAWEVLTDYDNMSRFISNVEYSHIQQRAGNLLTVRQSGKAKHGIFSIGFDNIREVELRPFDEIRSRLTGGDLRGSIFTTQLIGRDGELHIVNTGRYTASIWVPPIIGPALIESETRKQFGEMRAEMLRRQAQAAK
jgi:hypothetical protein